MSENTNSNTESNSSTATESKPSTSGALGFRLWTAAWCGPCRAVKPQIVTYAESRGMALEILDVDIQGDLAEVAGVRTVPTLDVVLPDGTLKARHIGAAKMVDWLSVTIGG